MPKTSRKNGADQRTTIGTPKGPEKTDITGRAGDDRGPLVLDSRIEGAVPNDRITFRTASISELHEDPANARLHGKRNLDAIRGSLAHFGQVETLVVQKSTGKVIGGNGRLKVMRELGWTEIRICEIDCDNVTATSLGIALNRTAELAEWDDETLAKLLHEVDVGDPELQQMMSELAEDQGLVSLTEETVLKPVDLKPPPAMSWVLIGIPTVRFGEIAADVERFGTLPEIVLETTVNDG